MLYFTARILEMVRKKLGNSATKYVEHIIEFYVTDRIYPWASFTFFAIDKYISYN